MLPQQSYGEWDGGQYQGADQQAATSYQQGDYVAYQQDPYTQQDTGYPAGSGYQDPYGQQQPQQQPQQQYGGDQGDGSGQYGSSDQQGSAPQYDGYAQYDQYDQYGQYTGEQPPYADPAAQHPAENGENPDTPGQAPWQTRNASRGESE
ncbi:Glycosyltransferase OS=Streptomyces cyaneofuscatus OX=66883 GN=G3I52_30945 PE=4 SV=1 [Streptomyces cyaneofuscatus]